MDLFGRFGWRVGPLPLLWRTSLKILSGFPDGPPGGG